MSSESFIDPKTLARVKDLPLVAKTVAEGFLYGLQASKLRGVGIEFSQYRPYEIGDELSRVDWKLFARNDRYFVREAERESEIDIWCLLDASASMLQKSESANGSQHWDKLEYAKHLIASMSYIAQKQGDSIGYLGMSSEAFNFLPAGSGDLHWRKLLTTMVQTKSGQNFPDIHTIKNIITQLRRPSIIFVISDFNQKDNEIIKMMEQLNSNLSEVVAIQLYCKDEIEFNYKGAIRFKDLETSEEVLVTARNAKAAYHANYQAYQTKMNEKLNQNNIPFQRFNIDKPLDQILFEYLQLRQRQRTAR